MSDFPPKIVRAIVPNEERPPKFLVDENGDLPHLEHSYDQGRTFEGTLSQLGRAAAGRAFSVDFLLESSSENEILYQAKPLCNDTVLRNGYTWADIKTPTLR
jgi:hypothetical protein